MSTIGCRIKEERERLGLSQPQLAALAKASKRTVIEWEKTATSPNAVQLSALAEHGLDAHYVVTGTRSNKPTDNYLSESEVALVNYYRRTDPTHREMVSEVCEAVSAKYQVNRDATAVYNSAPDSKICERLRIERERMGLSVDDLIESGYPRIKKEAYQRVESGTTPPLNTLTVVDCAAFATLGMDLHYILLGTRVAAIPTPRLDLNTIINTHSADIQLLRNVLQAMASLEDADPETHYTPAQKADAVIAVLYSALSTNSPEITPGMVISALAAAAR